MVEESDRGDQLKKRKKWIQTLSVLSSDEEELSGENEFQQNTTTIIDTGQIIALRFPYPMFSDDSDEDQELKCFSNETVKPENSKRKRKLIAFSDGTSKLSQENNCYKHKKRKHEETQTKKSTKLDNSRNIQKIVHKPYSKMGFQGSGKKSLLNQKIKTAHNSMGQTQEFLISASNENARPKGNRGKNNHLYKKKSNLSSIFINSPPLKKSTINDGKKYNSTNVTNKIHPQMFQHPSKGLQCTNSNISSSQNYEVEDKNKTQDSCTKESRFLSSSSENSDDENKCNSKKIKATKFRRLHVLSTSPSSSDSENPPIKSFQQSNTKPDHAISSSSEEEQNSKRSVPMTKETLPLSHNSHSQHNLKHPFENLIKASKTVQPHMSNNREVNLTFDLPQEDSFKLKAKQKNNTQPSKKEVCSLNTTVWKNIANVPLKTYTKPSLTNKNKVQDLKKQFVSSNVPAVEIYKKIHNNMSKSETTKPVLKKPLKSKKSLSNKLEDLFGNTLDDVQETNLFNKNREKTSTIGVNLDEENSNENKNTVNVNHNSIETTESNKISDKTNITSDKTKHNSIDSTSIEYTLPNIDENLQSAENENNASQSLETRKKVRYSHVDVKNKKKQPETKVLKNSSSKINSKEQKSKKIVGKSNSNSDEMEIRDTSAAEGKGCDVLGSILSEMENNRFKVQRTRVIKPTEQTPESLGRFPLGYNSSVTTGKPQTQSALTGVQILNKQNSQLEQKEKLETPNTFLSCTVPNPSYNPLSCTQKTTPREETVNHPTSDNKESQMCTNALHIKNKIQSQKTEENKSKKGTGAIMQFYSANSAEYANRSKEPDKHTQEKNSKIVKVNSPALKKFFGKNYNFIPDKKNTSTNQSQNHNMNAEKILNKDNQTFIVGKDLNNFTTTVKENPATMDHLKCSSVKGGNGEIRKDFLASNCNDSSKEKPKGVRVRLGGMEYRLKGSDSDKTNTNISIAQKTALTGTFNLADPHSETTPTQIKSSSEARKDNQAVKPNSDATDEESPIIENIIPNSNSNISEDTDSTSSSDDSSSLDSSSDSEQCTTDQSDSESSKSVVSSDSVKNTFQMNKSPTVIKENPVKSNSILEKKNKSLFMNQVEHMSSNTNINLKLSSKLRSEEANKVIETKNSLNIDSNDVIVLSGSSDSENFEQPLKINDKSSNSEKEEKGPITSTFTEHTSNVGKIRVRSLKELGIVNINQFSDNALVTPQLVSLPLETNIQHCSNLQTSNIPTTMSSNKENQSIVSHSSNTISMKNISSSHNDLGQNNSICGRQAVQNTLGLTAPTTNLHKGTLIAVIKPVYSESNQKTLLGSNRPVVNNSQNISGENISITRNEQMLQNNVDRNSQITSTPTPSQETALAIGQDQNAVQTMTPFTAKEIKSNQLETLFFKLCDDFFTDLVLFKIPKLVDDLHLLIAYDIMKEERFKKIDQLISPETIVAEKRRAEKDFSDMVRIRGQSFVPLFLTIVEKISRANLKTLVIALYCRIIHQLERLDPLNINYRFKLRFIIKNMILKSDSKLKDEILCIFSDNDDSFLANFLFINNLLLRYDNRENVNKNNLESVPSDNVNKEISSGSSDHSGGKSNQTDKNQLTSSATESPVSLQEIPSNIATVQALTDRLQVPDLPSKQHAPPPPPIGNLDRMLFEKFLKNLTPRTSGP